MSIELYCERCSTPNPIDQPSYHSSDANCQSALSFAAKEAAAYAVEYSIPCLPITVKLLSQSHGPGM